MRRFAAIIISLLVPAVAFAQTGGTPAPCVANGTASCHIALNTHTNNPKYGNETQFLRVANSATGVYHTSEVVHDGEVLSLRVYIDNDTNPKKVSNSGTNIVAAIKLDCAPTSATSQTICATISSPKADPQSLSSNLVLKGAQPFTLSPIENTATVHWATGNTTPTRAESTDNLLGPGINLFNVGAGYGNSVNVTQLVEVHMAAVPTGVTGGTAAPTPPTTPQPIAAAVTQPAPVNVTQIQGQGQTQNQGQSQPGSESQTPATPASPAASSQPAASTTQSQTQSPASSAANSNAVNDSTSDDAAIQSAQGQAQGQAQTQSAATTLPDTGATSATSGTLGLTLLLFGFGAYYRSRQSLWRRLRTHA